jgi:carbon-monoxide dehydrogenase small subunit/xanthine dehydrogenase YagT iron-sulfur-binding subunit
MTLRINGHPVDPGPSPDTTLLAVIRDQLGLTGTKEACGRGECGACTVLLDGRPIVSCIAFAALTQGDVTTIEGLVEESRDLREAFAEFGGFQCGFCTSGQVVHATAILRDLLAHPVDDPETAVRWRLSGNICRCTGYTGIVEAVLQTYRRRRSGRHGGEVAG